MGDFDFTSWPRRTVYKPWWMSFLGKRYYEYKFEGEYVRTLIEADWFDHLTVDEKNHILERTMQNQYEKICRMGLGYE